MGFNPGSGGGSSSLAGSTDVVMNNTAEGDFLVYDSPSQKWGNQAVSLTGDSAIVESSTVTSNYTLGLSDLGKIVETNTASANTITVPPASSVAFEDGSSIQLRQYGSGQTTVAGGSGVTIRSRGDVYKLAGQYAEAILTKRATGSGGGSTPVYRGSTGNTTNSTAISTNIPATTQTGDKLLAICVASDQVTIATPAGWALRSGYPKDGGAARLYIWERTAQAGDGGTSVVVNLSTSNKTCFAILGYAGANQTVSVENFAAEASTDTTRTSPAATSASASNIAITLFTYRGTNPSAWVAPSGTTQRQALYTGTTTGETALLICDSNGSIGGAGTNYTAKTATLTADPSVSGSAATLLLAPSGGSDEWILSGDIVA